MRKGRGLRERWRGWAGPGSPQELGSLNAVRVIQKASFSMMADDSVTALGCSQGQCHALDLRLAGMMFLQLLEA